ncbi:hypothetical protein D3C81_1721810 [compost metagenome]
MLRITVTYTDASTRNARCLDNKANAIIRPITQPMAIDTRASSRPIPSPASKVSKSRHTAAKFN